MRANDPAGGHSVQLGSQVTMRYENGRRSEVRIADGGQAPTTLDIAADSPLARVLLGKRAGDHVSLELAPGAVIAFVIIRVE